MTRGYGFYLAQIGFACFFLRGSDADKQDCGSAHGLLDGMAQGQSTAGQAAGEQIVQARLVEGDLAGSDFATLDTSSSAPITSQPISTKPRAVGRPTCPRPSTATRGLSQLD